MKYILLSFLFLSLAVGCTTTEKNPVLIENSGYAQGSTYQIKYLNTEKRNYAEEIESIFEDIDQSMSTYLPGSLISKVNEGDKWVAVDALFMEVLSRSMEIAEETNGQFDPTVGPLVSLWGFGYDEVRGDLSAEMIAQVKSKTGYDQIELRENEVKIPEGFSLDFNAIAQGYTVDVIADYLEGKGVQRYMVEVGGEVRTKGLNEKGSTWTIGVDKPQDDIDREDRFQFILELEDAALATSGNYRKFWVDKETGIKYSHTINPETGMPARNRLLSASMISNTAMDADAYATVCMVIGLEACKGFLDGKENLEGYLVYTGPDGAWEVYITEGFQKSIKE